MYSIDILSIVRTQSDLKIIILKFNPAQGNLENTVDKFYSKEGQYPSRWFVQNVVLIWGFALHVSSLQWKSWNISKSFAVGTESRVLLINPNENTLKEYLRVQIHTLPETLSNFSLVFSLANAWINWGLFLIYLLYIFKPFKPLYLFLVLFVLL